jgi:outer membrane protein assembly factor BamA
MLRAAKLALLFFLLLPSPAPRAQSAAPAARIASVSITGLRTLPPEPFLLIAALPRGASASKDDLQAAADRLLQLGLFSRITYEYRTFADGLSVTFHAEESSRVPVLFDNMPTLDDSEINSALRADLPYFDGTAPETGAALDAIANSLRQFLQSRKINAAVEHQLVPNPLGDGALQQFRAIGADARIASADFSDPLASSSTKLSSDLSALLGKPFSRLAIQIFLAEKVRPLYLQHGFLRVQFATPEIRLAGPPAKHLPDALPVFIPITPGIAYRWQTAEWSGNTALPSALLNELLRLPTGAIADGQAIDLAWERVLEEYGRRGFVNAKLSPQPHFDDANSSVSYRVAIDEENQYRHGDLLLTGLSLNAEAKVRAAWPIPPGEIFDKTKYEEFLEKLQSHSRAIFGNMPVNFDTVGHWIECHPESKTITVMLDFK